MSAHSVRVAGHDDLEALVAGNIAMARETESVTLDLETARAGVRAVLDDDSKGRYYVVDVDGEVAGQLMVTFEWSDWRNGLFLWIQSVYVAPRHRRRGVFRALYAHVLATAQTPGHCGVRLYVHDHNEDARETYSRLGLVAPGYEVLETPDELRRS